MLKNLLGIVSMLLFCSFAVQEQDKQSFGSMLSDAAIELTKIRVIYDPNYYVLDYPNGDLPADRGVCTDVVVRAYRKLGIDLQKEVHEDMKANFHLYPNNWGLSKPDRNIDHRRVPNLMVYFSRYGRIKAITTNPEDYQPGDIVAWDLGGGTTHIGIVINQKSHDGKRNLIVHNIGNGQEISDCLFEYSIIGHYQYPEW
ncbi:MAG: DUF1287 domain-containing protein [Tenuifilaceae bacterium]|jgi:hypothetical protein|nr:DUF1287 domain-containing protein [Bacteroidales bacterium]OQC61029.1 MAG: hypothetical protein BWX49_02477 [Bacteroidetes bacterium ADurb.Bin008]HNV82043.1 DUF1287 domain-containing protein [Tenuifilaceae bacterium]MZP81659.1 DUF1287 domain-containing protein [Bacteroidales bacterium]HOF92029.1 DUF1287 domain-containing protein [Tenuifilaceae bacterium]